MAGAFDLAGERALCRAGRAGATALSPRLLATSPLSPTTAAAAETALVTLGAALTAWSAAIVMDAEKAREAVGLLRVADDGTRIALRAFELRVGECAYESVPPDVHPTDLEVPMSTTAPTGLSSLVDHLDKVSRLSDEPGNNGTIEIQTLTGADGTRRHIVFLPGVDEWGLPGHDDDVRDLGAALTLAGGLPTAYGAGVLEALREAGVGPEEQVLLVGHSEGGMQAVQLAIHASPYDITDVVTLGSPTVPGDVPPGVDVLALEHLGDQVPLFDAGAEAGPGVVTVTFDSGISRSLRGNHVLAHYSAGAVAAEQSTDPVVQHAVAGLAPFLARPGDQVRSTVFQITRGHVPGSEEIVR
jgi:pimeloyl-ACP methyl ester carboxylesterase